MRKIFTVLSLVLLSTPALAEEWKDYSYPELGFAIQAPKAPEHSNQTVQSPAGPVDLHFYGIDLGNDAGMMAIVGDLPGTDSRTAADILEGARDGAVKAVNATIESDKKITYAGNPGREFTAKAAKYHVKARIILVGHKLVQMMAVSPVSVPIPSGTDKFFASLKLLK